MDSYEVDRMIQDAISKLRGDMQYEIDQAKRELQNEIQELDRKIDRVERDRLL